MEISSLIEAILRFEEVGTTGTYQKNPLPYKAVFPFW